MLSVILRTVSSFTSLSTIVEMTTRFRLWADTGLLRQLLSESAALLGQ